MSIWAVTDESQSIFSVLEQGNQAKRLNGESIHSKSKNPDEKANELLNKT